MYWVMGLFPSKGLDQDTVAARLHTSPTFTDRGLSGGSVEDDEVLAIMIISKFFFSLKIESIV